MWQAILQLCCGEAHEISKRLIEYNRSYDDPYSLNQLEFRAATLNFKFFHDNHTRDERLSFVTLSQAWRI